MYTTSTDGGVLWSSLVNVGQLRRELPDALEVATNALRRRRRGHRPLARRQGASASRASRRARAPVARRRIRGARVQVRSICDDGKLSLVVEAARGTRRVAPALGAAPRALRPHARRARPASARASAPATSCAAATRASPCGVIPRRGKARTLRLRVRRCRATR